MKEKDDYLNEIFCIKFKNYKILDVSIDNYGSRIIKNCD